MQKPMESTSDLSQAVETVLERLLRSAEDIRAREVELHEARENQKRLHEAFQGLLRVLPGDVRTQFEAKFAREIGVDTAPKPNVRNPIDAIFRMMKSSEKQAFRAEEVQKRLDEGGFDVSPRYAGNTLHRLYSEGKLERIGRGQYRLKNLYLSIPGLTPEDFDD